MEDFYINNTSVVENYNYRDIDHEYERNNSNIKKSPSIEEVVMYIIISVGLPLTLVAIYGLYSQVRNGHVAPIYIINLLISDILQLCSMIIDVAEPKNYFIEGISDFTYLVGLMASVGFMVCIALERYLVVAWPLWYRFRRNIKTSVVVCAVVWIVALVFLLSVFSWILKHEVSLVIYAVFLLLPFPLFIFFLSGTVKSLSAAISVPPDEKRRIVAILVLVLLIYTLLFLPTIILILGGGRGYTFWSVSFLLIRSSPLADLFLYVFSKKGVADMFLARVCGCKMNSDSDISSTTARMITNYK